MTLFILGLDRASLAHLDKMRKSIELPNFEKDRKGGKYGDLLSAYPFVTAAWTSIFTGVNPGKHGIFDMLDFTGGRAIPKNMRNEGVPLL